MHRKNLKNRSIEHGRNTELNQNTKKLFMFTFGLVLLFVGIQFIKLATIGRIGADISSVKNQQDSIELQNEILRMEINELRSASNLAEGIKDEQNLVRKNTRILKATTNTAIAQQ